MLDLVSELFWGSLVAGTIIFFGTAMLTNVTPAELLNSLLVIVQIVGG